MAAAQPVLAAAVDEAPTAVEIARHRSVGLAVATARRRKGIHQAELAAAVGVPRWSITLWEQGHQPIPPDKYRAVAAHLGLSIDAMAVTVPASLSAVEEALLRDYHSLPPEVAASFRALLAFAAARARGA